MREVHYFLDTMLFHEVQIGSQNSFLLKLAFTESPCNIILLKVKKQTPAIVSLALRDNDSQ